MRILRYVFWIVIVLTILIFLFPGILLMGLFLGNDEDYRPSYSYDPEDFTH